MNHHQVFSHHVSVALLLFDSCHSSLFWRFSTYQRSLWTFVVFTMFDVNQLQRKTNLRIVEINGIMCVCVCSNRTVCHINVHNVSVWFIQGCQIRQISFSLFGSVSEPLCLFIWYQTVYRNIIHIRCKYLHNYVLSLNMIWVFV